MSEWIETDRGPVDADCWHGCPRPPHTAVCDVDGCCCECRDRDGGRARELDARPAVVLDSVARDMAAESRPGVAEMLAERYGDHRTLAAERVRRSAA